MSEQKIVELSKDADAVLRVVVTNVGPNELPKGTLVKVSRRMAISCAHQLKDPEVLRAEAAAAQAALQAAAAVKEPSKQEESPKEPAAKPPQEKGGK